MMARVDEQELDKYVHTGKSDHYGAPFYPEDDRYEPEAWEQMTGNLWSHRRTRKATKKQRSPAHRRQLGGLWSQQSLVSKVLLGYLGIGAVVAVARAVKEVSALPAGATGYYGPIATGAVFDVVAWPYSVYQWAASASAASAAPMKKFSIGVPVPAKTLKKSASGSSTPGLF